MGAGGSKSDDSLGYGNPSISTDVGKLKVLDCFDLDSSWTEGENKSNGSAETGKKKKSEFLHEQIQYSRSNLGGGSDAFEGTASDTFLTPKRVTTSMAEHSRGGSVKDDSRIYCSPSRSANMQYINVPHGATSPEKEGNICTKVTNQLGQQMKGTVPTEQSYQCSTQDLCISSLTAENSSDAQVKSTNGGEQDIGAKMVAGLEPNLVDTSKQQKIQQNGGWIGARILILDVTKQQKINISVARKLDSQNTGSTGDSDTVASAQGDIVEDAAVASVSQDALLSKHHMRESRSVSKHLLPPLHSLLCQQITYHLLLSPSNVLKKTPDNPCLKVSRPMTSKNDPLYFNVPREIKPSSPRAVNPRVSINATSEIVHSLGLQKYGLSSPSLKRKKIEGFNADPATSYPLKRFAESPNESRKPTEASERFETTSTLQSSSYQLTSTVEFTLDSRLSALGVPLTTENDGIAEKAEAYTKELDDICNMLKKKHEEAKELLVRAVVNNNNLLMLNHSVYEEKISFELLFLMNTNLDLPTHIFELVFSLITKTFVPFRGLLHATIQSTKRRYPFELLFLMNTNLELPTHIFELVFSLITKISVPFRGLLHACCSGTVKIDLYIQHMFL
ncbi:hypothetical protein MKX01_030971 [Papaver californicum]|nr:hypothetical protein MKX01_030971 [Papaver californicum]